MNDTRTVAPPMQRRKLRKVDAAMRRRIERAIERMIQALDAFDAPTEDLEDVGDDEPDDDGEPSLGWTEMEARFGCKPMHAGTVDLEDEHDGREPQGDREPSLGSVAVHESSWQTGWAQGLPGDLEDEHDGREPDVDDEPSLGSFDRLVNQERSWRTRDLWFCNLDLEDDPAEGPEGDDEREHDLAEESGIGDADGLLEQHPQPGCAHFE